MQVTKVTFAKIATNPSTHAWSQTYSAGNFAALIALVDKEKKDEDSLQTLGGQIVSTLESEYFTLEEKNLSTIKNAIEQAIAHITPDVDATIIVATVINTVLYLFLFGNGKVFIKRGSEAGVLLEKPALAIETMTAKPGILTASGYLHSGDCVIMATDALLQHISREDFLSQMTPDNSEELAETFMTKLHRKKDGSACGIMFSFSSDETVTNASGASPQTAFPPVSEPVISYNTPTRTMPRIAIPSLHFPALGLKRIVLIGAAVLIIGIIIGNIFLSVRRQKQKLETAKFESAYTNAQSKYKEGSDLLALNKTEAQDDFTQIVTTLSPFQAKFPPTSSENQRLTDLLKKAEDGLTAAKAENQISGKQASEGDSPILASEMKNTNAKYAAQDNTRIYLGDNTAVTSITKSDNTTKTIIKNAHDWEDLGGIGTYLGNMYVLDKKGTLLKYVASSNGFGKTDYFNGTKVDLSHASALTIDGSVYILSDDGSIKKFTKGKQDTFSLSGLDKPFAHPTRIATTVDQNNIYVLDNGNNRIAVLNKNGAYQAQYTAGFLTQAIDFDVSESSKKIFVLSANKLWEVDMK